MSWIVILALLIGFLIVYVDWAYKRLQAQPDPLPYETLRQPLRGREETVTSHDGTQLWTVTMGDGSETVLLAHGYGVTSREWNVIAEQLVVEGYRVIAFDQRGHGKSTVGNQGISSHAMAGDYRTLIEHFGLDGAVLVGHSMGTFVSMVFLLTYPEVAKRLRAAVLLSPFAGDVFHGSPQSRIQIYLIRFGLMQAIVGSEGTGAVLFGSTLYGDRPSPAGVRVFLEDFRSNNQSVLVPILEAFGNENYYDRVSEIKLPVTLICGRKDRTTPPWHAQQLAARIPDSHTIWVEGAGHLLNWEAPEVVVDAIRTAGNQPVS